jgi:hypothetical protein
VHGIGQGLDDGVALFAPGDPVVLLPADVGAAHHFHAALLLQDHVVLLRTEIADTDLYHRGELGFNPSALYMMLAWL